MSVRLYVCDTDYYRNNNRTQSRVTAPALTKGRASVAGAFNAIHCASKSCTSARTHWHEIIFSYVGTESIDKLMLSNTLPKNSSRCFSIKEFAKWLEKLLS